MGNDVLVADERTGILRTVTDADSPSVHDDLVLALELADIADAISAQRFRANDLHVSKKPDRTHVTDADKAVERAIREHIASVRASDSIYGEEYGTEGSSTRRWIIDPIDGTANYVRGVPVWGTLIALAVDGIPIVGVASSPALRKRWWAATGEGAWAREDDGDAYPIQVSSVSTLEDASISFQSIHQWDKNGYLDQLIELSRTVWRDRAYGDLWSYTLLAEGLIDAVAEFGVEAYDVAALIPIVREAGGTFTTVMGGDPLMTGNPLASNGALHDAMLSALA